MLFLLKDNLPPTTDRLPQIMCTNLLGYYSAEGDCRFFDCDDNQIAHESFQQLCILNVKLLVSYSIIIFQR